MLDPDLYSTYGTEWLFSWAELAPLALPCSTLLTVSRGCILCSAHKDEKMDEVSEPDS